jgi:cysteine desulfuration protein SufE
VSIEEKQRQFVEAFGIISDRQERLAAIVDRARKRAPLPAEKRSLANRVAGCVSPVWVVAEFNNGALQVQGDAEAPLVKGFVRLLCDLYDGSAPEDAATFRTTLLSELDILRDLSPTRRAGLEAVQRRLNDLARSFVSK